MVLLHLAVNTVKFIVNLQHQYMMS